jgi:exoribonuclease-2
MERYWTLKFLKQQGVNELLAQVVKDLPGQAPVVRANDVQLAFPLLGAPQLQRGQTVLVRLVQLDELSLDVRAEFIRLLDGPDGQSASTPALGDDEEEDLTPTGVVLALDANETENPAP